jgi:hypothetical protein
LIPKLESLPLLYLRTKFRRIYRNTIETNKKQNKKDVSPKFKLNRIWTRTKSSLNVPVRTTGKYKFMVAGLFTEFSAYAKLDIEGTMVIQHIKISSVERVQRVLSSRTRMTHGLCRLCTRYFNS